VRLQHVNPNSILRHVERPIEYERAYVLSL
jgi:hypothetical protein